MVNTSEVRFYARWGSALCLARESGAAARARRCSAPGLRTLRGLRPCPAALCAPHSAAGCLCVVGCGRCAYDLRLSFLFVAVP